jgi:hypothetical protein
VLARALRLYNVLSVGALGVLILTGASSLTSLKVSLRADYGRLLWPLAAKLGLTFALVLTGTWLSFGIAHRLVRAELGDLPVEPERQRGMLRRMRAAAWIALALTAWTAWVGIGLGRVAATASRPPTVSTAVAPSLESGPERAEAP